MRPADIVSIGGIAVDVILALPQLPTAGRCVPASALDHGIGGKAANQAVAAARLGGSVSIVGATGADAAGDDLLARLDIEGVSTRFVHRAAGVQTGMVVLQRDDTGRKQTAVFRGANAAVSREVIDAAEHEIRAARVVMVQLEIPLESAVYAMQIARSGEAQVIFDPSPIRAIPPELFRLATVLKANAEEASALTGIRVTDLPSARAAAALLLERGVRIAAIEAGGSGNLFCSATEEVFLPLYDVAATDVLGAGDAMVGAFAVALVESRSLREAATFATAAAALATRGAGAQAAMPRRDELTRFVAR
jgi:ribokinase